MNQRFARRTLCLAVLLAASTSSTALATRHDYRFIKVVDDVGSGFSPYSLACSAVNNSSEVVFKASRDSASFPYEGIYRVGRNGEVTTIAEDPSRESYLF